PPRWRRSLRVSVDEPFATVSFLRTTSPPQKSSARIAHPTSLPLASAHRALPLRETPPRFGGGNCKRPSDFAPASGQLWAGHGEKKGCTSHASAAAAARKTPAPPPGHRTGKRAPFLASHCLYSRCSAIQTPHRRSEIGHRQR